MADDFFRDSAAAGVVLSFLAYYAGLNIRKKSGRALLNPLLTAIVLVIGVLYIFDIDYDSYNSSAGYLSYFLTPATVSLAIPMYQKMHLLKKYPGAILFGILSGAAASLVSVLVLSLMFGLTHEQYVTLLPKSITTAIGMDVSAELGGIPSVTAAVIIITGLFGISLGTAAHAIGTAKAMETGKVEGAMSSLSIVISGICTVALANLFSGFL